MNTRIYISLKVIRFILSRKKIFKMKTIYSVVGENLYNICFPFHWLMEGRIKTSDLQIKIFNHFTNFFLNLINKNTKYKT